MPSDLQNGYFRDWVGFLDIDCHHDGFSAPAPPMSEAAWSDLVAQEFNPCDPIVVPENLSVDPASMDYSSGSLFTTASDQPATRAELVSELSHLANVITHALRGPETAHDPMPVGPAIPPLPSIKHHAWRRKPFVACVYCRGRKIACHPPTTGFDNRCGQCARRNRKCEFTHESEYVPRRSRGLRGSSKRQKS